MLKTRQYLRAAIAWAIAGAIIFPAALYLNMISTDNGYLLMKTGNVDPGAFLLFALYGLPAGAACFALWSAARWIYRD